MLKSKPRLLALAIAATLTPSALQAAVLEEVQVTATKRTESVQNTVKAAAEPRTETAQPPLLLE